MGEVVVVNPLTNPHWNTLLLSHPDSTIFHSSNWARVICETYHYSPAYFALFRGGVFQGCIAAMEVGTFWGRRGVSLSFSDSCGSLTHTSDLFEYLKENVLQYGQKNHWKSMEFRGETFLKQETSSQTYFYHQLDLSNDENVMFSRLRQNHARNIGKAMREGVQVQFSTSLEAVYEYYRLHCLTRKRQGLPPQPIGFFKNLHRFVIAERFGFTALALYKGAAIAGIICLSFNRQAVYKYGASDTAFQQLRPSNLVLWETIKRCAREGYHNFSLGRTDIANDGLLFFKDGWGANAALLGYYKYDFSAGDFTEEARRDLSRYQKVLRRLPVHLLRGIGNLLYRHVG